MLSGAIASGGSRQGRLTRSVPGICFVYGPVDARMSVPGCLCTGSTPAPRGRPRSMRRRTGDHVQGALSVGHGIVPAADDAIRRRRALGARTGTWCPRGLRPGANCTRTPGRRSRARPRALVALPRRLGPSVGHGSPLSPMQPRSTRISDIPRPASVPCSDCTGRGGSRASATVPHCVWRAVQNGQGHLLVTTLAFSVLVQGPHGRCRRLRCARSHAGSQIAGIT